MRTREQKGYVWKVGAWWWIRYADSVVENGTVIRKQGLAMKLAPVLREQGRCIRPPDSVREEQKRFMERINGSRLSPERNVTLADFVRNVWLPAVEIRHAASTVHADRYYWQHILAPRCGRILLRDFSTPTAQLLLDDIARQNRGMKKATLHKLKSKLSAIFKLAIQQGYRPGPNPIRETSLPRAPEGEETFAYDLNSVFAILQVLPEPSRTVVAIAAFAGLRRGELEGLLWESYDGDTLKVMRAMWQGIVGEREKQKIEGSRSRNPAAARSLGSAPSSIR